MMKRIMNEGGLIPYQLTVQVLVNAMIAEPSKVSQTFSADQQCSLLFNYENERCNRWCFSFSNRQCSYVTFRTT